MEYTLMHKNIAVVELVIDETISAITKIGDVHHQEHLPIGVPVRDSRPDRKSLNDWWIGRSIPASRSGLRDALAALRISSPQFLLTKCFGLSLSDQYWVRPALKSIEWEDVNFFDNSFSEDVGNALFGRAPEGGDLDLMSPDNTSDGWLKKKWVVANKKRLLLKGGSNPYFQEPLNEVIASRIMKRLAIPHVQYDLTWDGDQPLSACEDFITADTDLISAWYIKESAKKPEHLSGYQHLLACCEALGIPKAKDSLNQMLTLDYLIVNADRHFNNFGAVRNAESLEWLGMAPIYDSGTSLWYDQLPQMIRPRGDQASKPFRSKHAEQIKLVTDFKWLDLAALDGVDEECAEILKQSQYIDDARRDILCFSLQNRVKMLEEIIRIAR
ncbi:MAG: excisionase [Clostridiales bacterium]|jgi:hypothetical protein|nr:excisionase [Clostridiales bacterium]